MINVFLKEEKCRRFRHVAALNIAYTLMCISSIARMQKKLLKVVGGVRELA